MSRLLRSLAAHRLPLCRNFPHNYLVLRKLPLLSKWQKQMHSSSSVLPFTVQHLYFSHRWRLTWASKSTVVQQLHFTALVQLLAYLLQYQQKTLENWGGIKHRWKHLSASELVYFTDWMTIKFGLSIRLSLCTDNKN